MNIENLAKKLKKYNYKHTVTEQKIVVNLGLSQRVEITKTDDEKVEIKDKLAPWNPISGFGTHSLRWGVLYYTIFTLLLFFILVYQYGFLDKSVLFVAFIVQLIYVFFWITYYSIRLESFKQQLVFFIETDNA